MKPSPYFSNDNEPGTTSPLEAYRKIKARGHVTFTDSLTIVNTVTGQALYHAPSDFTFDGVPQDSSPFTSTRRKLMKWNLKAGIVKTQLECWRISETFVASSHTSTTQSRKRILLLQSS
jgi:hypothetical protein